MLLEHVLEALAADNVTLVEAKTLDASADYEPYIATRAFWERHGFVHIDTIDPLPGWGARKPRSHLRVRSDAHALNCVVAIVLP